MPVKKKQNHKQGHKGKGAVELDPAAKQAEMQARGAEFIKEIGKLEDKYEMVLMFKPIIERGLIRGQRQAMDTRYAPKPEGTPASD